MSHCYELTIQTKEVSLKVMTRLCFLLAPVMCTMRQFEPLETSLTEGKWRSGCFESVSLG